MHVVLVSGALVTPKNRYHPVRLLLQNVIRYDMCTEKVRSRAQRAAPAGKGSVNPDNCKTILFLGAWGVFC